MCAEKPNAVTSFSDKVDLCTSAHGESIVIFKCPYCRAEYELTTARLSFRQRSHAKCHVFFLPDWPPPGKQTERATLPPGGPPGVGVANCIGFPALS